MVIQNRVENDMRINPLEIQHAQPGNGPVVAEKFFIQKTAGPKPSTALRIDSGWQDADVDGNWSGFDSIERVRRVQEGLIISHHYGRGVRLRVIKSTCTIETEVVR